MRATTGRNMTSYLCLLASSQEGVAHILGCLMSVLCELNPDLPAKVTESKLFEFNQTTLGLEPDLFLIVWFRLQRFR